MKATQSCLARAVRPAQACTCYGVCTVALSSSSSSLRVFSSSRHPHLSPSPSTLRTSRRAFSQQVSDWVGKLAYGAEHAPFFGSRGNAFSVEALATRQLYCKALVHTSGGSRSARDWIAGSTALSSPNQALLHIALQYTATEADVWQLRASLLETILDREDAKDGGEGDAEKMSSDVHSAGSDVSASTAPAERQSSEDTPTDDDILAAEAFLLSHAPEVRCFLFDAMTASLFNAHNNVDSVERCRQRIFSVGQRIFGVPREVLVSLWRVAQADLVIRRDKQRAFGQSRMD